MLSGMGTALGEITLVLFTTLAPSGVVAFILMGLPLLRAGLAADARRRINQFLSVPLVAAMVGLVASATHLGNPANALYVFLGVGRSPLSTEVFCAVVFLALAGVYWLYSFAERPRVGLQRPWMVLAMAAGVVFVTSVAFAYNAETIVSWYTVYVPLNLWLNALVGGPVLALVGLRAARWEPACGRFGRCGAGAVDGGPCREPRVVRAAERQPAVHRERVPRGLRPRAVLRPHDRRVRRAGACGHRPGRAGPARPHAGGAAVSWASRARPRRARSCWPASSSCASRST